MGASALLGSAIANPVAGRLQRFFGVSKLRIDPTLSGRGKQPAGAPDARAAGHADHHVHLYHQRHQQQSAGGPGGVGLLQTWSVVALREENGLFGMDFFYKRRFK